MIAEESIQAIRDLPIDQVVGRYIKITKNGACCPFHDEKTPSFRVNPLRNFYKCFGCGESGDGIRFVQKIESISFYEALEKLASDHNINIIYQDSGISPEERKNRKDRENLAHEVLEYVQSHFQVQLKQSPEALQYLNSRGYTPDDIEYWGLGYAPDSHKMLTTKLIQKEWYQIASDLGVIRTKDGNTYDFYRNRITIPIRNKMGMLVGFGARLIGPGEPKYLNPPESFIYQKGSTLFGMDRASKPIRDAINAFLVEGYFDVISMHKVGAQNTVASCGTAVVDAQLTAIKSLTDTITLMSDGDKAGLKSSTDLVPRCLKIGFNTLVAALDAQDPDDFSKQYFKHETGTSEPNE